MSRIAYVDGRYVPHTAARVHIEDRGYQFADGVYEVIAVERGRLVDETEHLDRLDRSLAMVRMAWPLARSALRVVLREVVRRNRIDDRGLAYLQVTRGVAPRNHAFPPNARSVLVVTARALPPIDPEAHRHGVAVITIPDLRWKRTDIKSTSLLPNVLGKQLAVEAGAYEAWLTDESGFVTEGTSSNAWIVTKNREVVTRHADQAILNGITRQAVLAIVRDQGLDWVERPFTVGEAKGAAEAFLTSTSSLIKPVVRIDETEIGGGAPGPFTLRLLELYLERLRPRAEGEAP